MEETGNILLRDWGHLCRSMRVESMEGMSSMLCLDGEPLITLQRVLQKSSELYEMRFSSGIMVVRYDGIQADCWEFTHVVSSIGDLSRTASISRLTHSRPFHGGLGPLDADWISRIDISDLVTYMWCEAKSGLYERLLKGI